MTKEARHVSDVVTILGTGEIGDKARQLQEKSGYWIESGYAVPPRVAIAHDVIVSYLEQGEFSPIYAACRGIANNQPVYIRSSAAGEAGGTGTYKSVATRNNHRDVEAAAQKVIQSYWTPSALAFRRDIGVGERFGLLFEPMVGTWYEDYFAPLFSGYAYTSTPGGDGQTVLVPGLGSGVDTSTGLTISESSLQEYGTGFLEYLLHRKQAHIRAGLPLVSDALLWKSDGSAQRRFPAHFFANGYGVPEDERDNENIYYGELYIPRSEFDALNTVQLDAFFLKLKNLEQQCGAPQYIEWALTLQKRRPVFWLLQIADMHIPTFEGEMPTEGQIVITGIDVRGSGVAKSDTVVFIRTPSQISELGAFNETHTGYVLVFDGSIVSHQKGREVLPYSTYSNAAVLLEKSVPHAYSIHAHLSHEAYKTGKFVGVIDVFSEGAPPWETLLKKFSHDTKGTLQVLHGNFSIAASEKTNTLVVRDLE